MLLEEVKVCRTVRHGKGFRSQNSKVGGGGERKELGFQVSQKTRKKKKKDSKKNHCKGLISFQFSLFSLLSYSYIVMMGGEDLKKKKVDKRGYIYRLICIYEFPP